MKYTLPILTTYLQDSFKDIGQLMIKDEISNNAHSSHEHNRV